MTCETEFRELCRTIVVRVYGALGTRLESEEIVQVASELAVAIVVALGQADEPAPELAGVVMEDFFRDRGIANQGDAWRWVN